MSEKSAGSKTRYQIWNTRHWKTTRYSFIFFPENFVTARNWLLYKWIMLAHWLKSSRVTFRLKKYKQNAYDNWVWFLQFPVEKALPDLNGFRGRCLQVSRVALFPLEQWMYCKRLLQGFVDETSLWDHFKNYPDIERVFLTSWGFDFPWKIFQKLSTFSSWLRSFDIGQICTILRSASKLCLILKNSLYNTNLHKAEF